MNKQDIKEWLKGQPYMYSNANPEMAWLEDLILACFNELAPKWVSVEDELPSDDNCYVLVFCEGGNVDKSFYCTNREFLSKGLKSGRYSRKVQGKNSGYFELSHKYGYKITHWMSLPTPPKANKLEGGE